MSAINNFNSSIQQTMTFRYADPRLVVFKKLTDAGLVELLKKHTPSNIEDMCLAVRGQINDRMRFAVSKELQEKFAQKQVRFAIEEESTTSTSASPMRILNDDEIDVDVATDADRSFIQGMITNVVNRIQEKKDAKKAQAGQQLGTAIHEHVSQASQVGVQVDVAIRAQDTRGNSQRKPTSETQAQKDEVVNERHRAKKRDMQTEERLDDVRRQAIKKAAQKASQAE